MSRAGKLTISSILWLIYISLCSVLYWDTDYDGLIVPALGLVLALFTIQLNLGKGYKDE